LFERTKQLFKPNAKTDEIYKTVFKEITEKHGNQKLIFHLVFINNGSCYYPPPTSGVLLEPGMVFFFRLGFTDLPPNLINIEKRITLLLEDTFCVGEPEVGLIEISSFFGTDSRREYILQLGNHVNNNSDEDGNHDENNDNNVFFQSDEVEEEDGCDDGYDDDNELNELNEESDEMMGEIEILESQISELRSHLNSAEKAICKKKKIQKALQARKESTKSKNRKIVSQTRTNNQTISPQVRELIKLNIEGGDSR